jgi:hypothetical protein
VGKEKRKIGSLVADHPDGWKSALINIQISGRLVYFKTVSKQEYETRRIPVRFQRKIAISLIDQTARYNLG